MRGMVMMRERERERLMMTEDGYDSGSKGKGDERDFFFLQSP